jgi:perosamine synthetase
LSCSYPVGEQFAIGFDHRDRAALHEMWDQIFESNRWSEGPLTERFESSWSQWNWLSSVAFSSWTGGALAALDFCGVSGHTVLCPSNTFMATPLAIQNAGGQVQFVDCGRQDLCVSFEDFKTKAEQYQPKAAFVVHIGGHIAFEVEAISAYCRAQGIFLIEDCAHAHGASWGDRYPGSWGDAGVYSFYATKTISTGEGGMLVSSNDDLIQFAKAYRNYGKPDHNVEGLNYRLSEFTAAIGLVQTERLEEIVTQKNAYAREILDPQHPGRLLLPDGMVSGLYKYIVFDEIEKTTGKVYDQPCHRIMGHDVNLPNTDWVAGNHWCAPIYYRQGIPESVS